MKKTLTSLFLSFILVFSTTTSAFAASGYMDSFNDALDSLTNVQTFTEEDGTQNIYTKSVSVQFDFDMPTKPIFSFTPPSIEAGCNGIDIKGMFMALLGLDQLGEMLQNAGTTLAWGIAVGLIYSLPGIGQAFKFINAWARKIQQLLADACNAGIKIGMWLGEKIGANTFDMFDTINDFFAKLDPGVYVKEHQKGSGSILLDFLGIDLTGDGEEGTPSEKQKAVVKLLKGVFQSDSSTLGATMTDVAARLPNGIFTNIFGIKGLDKHTGSSSTPDVPAIAEHRFVLTFTGTAKPDGVNQSVSINDLANRIANSGGFSMTTAAEVQLALMAYILQFNFVGDLAINTPDITEIQELVALALVSEDGTKAEDNTSITSDSNKKSKAREELDKMQKNGYNKISVVGPGANLPSEDAGKMLASYLWYGVEDSGGNISPFAKGQATKLKKALKAPVGQIYVVIDEDSGTGSSFITVLPKTWNTHGLVDFYDGGSGYRGVLTEARCVVNSLVDGVDPAEVDDNSTFLTPDGPVMISKNCNAKVIFPEALKYAKIIQDSPSSRKFSLKNKLIKMMAVKMAEALLGAMSEAASRIYATDTDYLPTTMGSGGGDLAKAKGAAATAQDKSDKVLALKQRTSDVVQAAYDQLEKYFGEKYLTDVAKTEEIFRTQARENQQRGLKSLQK